MDIRKLFLILGGCLVALILYLIFSTGSAETKKKKTRSEEISQLLMGGSSVGESEPLKRGQRVRSNSSLFDSEFAKAGTNVNYAEEDTNTVSNDDMIVPINPQTGKPYDEETMEQFDKLRLIFPGNDLIPRKYTKEQKAKKDEEDAKYAQATTAYLNNTATKEQVELYFNRQEKTLRDRLEIVEYLIDAQKEDGEYDKNGEFQKILDSTNEQLKNLEIQKQEAFKKYGI